jgi:hypothetical protein
LEVTSSGSASTAILRNTSSTAATYSELFFAPFTGVTAASAAIRSTYSGFNDSSIEFLTTASTSAPTEKMRLNSSGNLGLGVTPSTSNAGRTFEINTVGNQIRGNGVNDMNMESNTRYNSNFLYASTGTATRYAQNGGVHSWWNAPSGTAGNAITFTQAMTLDASGNLLVNTTSAVSGSKLVVASGDATIYGLTVGRGAGAVSTNTAVGNNALSV